MSYEGVTFTTRGMRYECELTEEDLEGKYMDNSDCPLHRSMKRAGVDVRNVGGTTFSTNDGHSHDFTARIKELNGKLQADDKHHLIGERFTVKI